MKNEPKIGNLYPSKGGRDTKFWLLISIKEKENRAILLGLDKDFEIVSGQTYSLSTFERRTPIGFMDIEDIRFYDNSRSQQPRKETSNMASSEVRESLQDPSSWPVREQLEADGDVSES